MPKPDDFWSRRRRAVAKEEARDVQPAPEVPEADPDVDDETLLQMLGLPDPETLTPKDAALFMAREVPGRLRKRAMRALFARNLHLSPPDGLLDYNEDYTDAAVNLRPPKVIWEKVERLAEKALEKEEPTPEQEPEPEDEPQPEVIAELNDEVDMEEDLAQPRRMVFTFSEDEA